MESVLVFFSLWTLFGVQGITQKVFPQSAYRTWLDAESSCRKDNLGLLVNLDSLTKDTTFDLEVSITDSDQYWTGRYRLGLFYWKYGCFTLDSAAIFMTGNLKEIGGTNSVSECARFCGEERQWVALVKRFCYCLIDVDETALDASRCPSPCPGDRMDSCGSDQAMSVYKTLNKTKILDDITRKPIGENQMCVFIMSDAGVIRWKVDNCTQQKIVLCQKVTKSGIEFVSPHRTPKTWLSANEDCQRGSMTLAVVTQNDVKKSPIDKLPPNVHVWVALRRHDLFYWTSGDIRNDPTDCLAVQKDTYGNLVKSWFPCSDQFKYVCLSEGQPPTVESASPVLPTQPIATESNAFTNASNGLPNSGESSEQSDNSPTTELILVILIFLALVLLAVFVLVQWAVKRRRRKSIRLNRRTSKEITFKGEDEMLIRSFHTSEDKTTLSPKPMPRIDIDTGSLQILASIPENKKKLHRSDDTLDIPWIDASMNTLDNVSVSRDTETRSDTIGTKALSAPELDRIGVDSDDEDDVPHPCAMRTFSKQNEPILESEI
uniref:WSC domain-containing protein n=1 Tax=Magallana gigas TaxID=29159 RepID=A0A8W8IAN1_MAGGI